MFGWLKKLFRPRFKAVASVGFESEEELKQHENDMQDVLWRCWSSGNVIIGDRQDDGTWKVTEIENERT